MGSKSSKKKNARRQKSEKKGVRVVDVRQALSQQLHGGAVVKLEQLLQTDSRRAHLGLAADVFTTATAAAKCFRFVPEKPAEFLQLVDSILERLAIGQSSATAGDNASDQTDQHHQGGETALEQSVLESVDWLRRLFGDTSVDADLDPVLVQTMCDQAVQKPELRNRLSADLAEQVQRVIEGLEHVAAGNDDAALDAVNTIGFRSVMAPWRLLVRGMVHFYAGRTEQSQSVWVRLPDDRLPYGIARAMLATAGQTLADQPIVDQRQLASLHDKKLPDLETTRSQLLEWFEDDQQDEIAESINNWAEQGQVCPSILDALRDRVYADMIVTPDRELVQRVVTKLPPPVWDPELQLPRAIAELLSSDPTEKASHAAVDRYLESVQTNQNLSEADRTAVTTVVAAQVAFLLVQLLEKCSGGRGRDAESERQRVETGSKIGEVWAGLLLKCTQLSPHWDEPLQRTALEEIDPALLPKEIVAEIHQTRLKAREDDLEVLRQAAGFYLLHDLELARPLVQRLIQLAPRDVQTRERAWLLERMSFVQAIQKGEFEQASVHVDQMAFNIPIGVSPGVIPLYHAIVELSRNEAADVDTLIAESAEQGLSRLAALFLMEIVAAKCGLSAQLRKGFREARKPLSKMPSLQDVEDTCRLVGQSITYTVEDFPGRTGQLKELIATTKRAFTQSSRQQWTIEAANEIGSFVVAAEDDVLRRQFLRAIRWHSDWHICILIRAIEGDIEDASYHLAEVVEADKNDPNGLPAPLRQTARNLFSASEERRQHKFMGDLDDDDLMDDFDELELDDFSNALDSMDEMPPEMMGTIPPELVLAYRADPQIVEQQMRQTMPGPIAEMMLKILRLNASQSAAR